MKLPRIFTFLLVASIIAFGFLAACRSDTTYVNPRQQPQVIYQDTWDEPYYVNQQPSYYDDDYYYYYGDQGIRRVPRSRIPSTTVININKVPKLDVNKRNEVYNNLAKRDASGQSVTTTQQRPNANPQQQPVQRPNQPPQTTTQQRPQQPSVQPRSQPQRVDPPKVVTTQSRPPATTTQKRPK